MTEAPAHAPTGARPAAAQRPAGAGPVLRVAPTQSSPEFPDRVDRLATGRSDLRGHHQGFRLGHRPPDHPLPMRMARRAFQAIPRLRAGGPVGRIVPGPDEVVPARVDVADPGFDRDARRRDGALRSRTVRTLARLASPGRIPAAGRQPEAMEDG